MFGNGFGFNSKGGVSVPVGSKLTLNTATGNLGVKISDHLSIGSDGLTYTF